MAKIYHASATPLPIGTVLESRFIEDKLQFQFHAISSALKEGEAVLKSLLLSDYWHQLGKPTLTFAFKETVLERIRASEFPDRPSRLASVFLSPTKHDIIRFREEVRGTNDRPHLYTCRVAADAPLFQADIAFVRGPNALAPIKEQIDYLIQQARLYWEGRKSDDPITEMLAPQRTVEITAEEDW